jgi:hypothetical protein
MQCSSSIEFKDWLTIAGLMISVSTLILAGIVYKKIIGNEARKIQLELVRKTVGIFNLASLPISLFNDNNKLIDYKNFNLFKLANLQIKKETIHYQLYFPQHYMIIIDTGEIINDPFLPSGIANALVKFHSSFQMDKEPLFPFNRKDCYILGYRANTEITIPPDRGLNLFEGGIKSMVNQCFEIKSEVIKWLRKNGVKEINDQLFHQTLD